MAMAVTLAQVIAACLLSLAGLAAIWRAWVREAGRWPFIGLALMLWTGASALWIIRFGPEIGTALAIESASLLAFAFMLSRMERQSPRSTEARVVPEANAANLANQVDGQSARRWRIAARIGVAGPLALAAALSLGLMVAIRAPLHEQTRLIIGGLAVPTLWAIMIVTTVALRRVWPTALAGLLIVLSSAALAWLGR